MIPLIDGLQGDIRIQQRNGLGGVFGDLAAGFLDPGVDVLVQQRHQAVVSE